MIPTKRLQTSLALGAMVLAAYPALAEVRLPALFSDHMVLQQAALVPVWGWADPGEEVVVSIAGQRKSVRAGADGKWKLTLDKLPPGQGLTLTVKGKNSLTVNDVLVGEVWLGSGQSNMALTVAQAQDFEKEKEKATLPQVRMFIVKSGGAGTAQEDCQGSWQVCTPATVGGFSATLFFFGRELHQSLGVPVGLINSSVGGTPIEQWISPQAQRAVPASTSNLPAKTEKTVPGAVGPEAKRKVRSGLGGLFNGKIAPLIPYSLRGAVWYQGEANAHGNGRLYEHKLALLVNDWRARWGDTFPFAWVQLPNFIGRGENWCLVREGMLKCLKLPKTGMAVTVDIGEPTNIHPKNKQEVGRRLSLWALGAVYGKSVAAISGPLPAGHELRGSEIVVSFAHTEGGLMAKGGELKGFSLAGEDRQWHPAQARIEGNRIIVSSPQVKRPVAARYAWQDNPECNLYNGAGLPASPFRTDTD